MRDKRMEYVVIYEKGDSSYGAYVPDLPGCITVGETLEETQTLIQEAIEFHIEGLQEDGDPVPTPSLNLSTQCDIPFFGKHKIIETYINEEYPVLFSCKDYANYLYLVTIGENDQHKTWLRVVISKERFNLIRSGGIDLRNAFTDTENGYLFRIRVPHDDPTQSSPEVIHPNEISEDMLPLPGERLGLKTDTLPALRSPQEEETSETIRIHGTLVGISLRDKSFEIETTNENYYEKDFFKGKITDEAFETESIRNATVSKPYTAEIQGFAEIGETKDESNIKFRLLSLSQQLLPDAAK